MTREELRVFLDTFMCGCGAPPLACAALLCVLTAYEQKDGRGNLRAWTAADTWVPDDGMRYLFLYLLDATGVLEHGSVVDRSWLTPKGEAVRAALQQEASDDFDALLVPCCEHGFAIDDTTHDCATTDPDERRQVDRRQASARTHFRGVVWPRQLPGEALVTGPYRYAVVGVLVTEEPIARYGENEHPLDGHAPGLGEALAQIAPGHPPDKLGDATDVLLNLDTWGLGRRHAAQRRGLPPAGVGVSGSVAPDGWSLWRVPDDQST